MDELFIDTNIVLDLLQRRDGFFEEAQALFTLADRNQVKLFISSLTIANTHYILLRHHKTNDARKILSKFKLLVEVLSMDDKIMELALNSDLGDFEDAIQFYTALENGVGTIITRNKKDFKKVSLPVLSAKEYLNMKKAAR